MFTIVDFYGKQSDYSCGYCKQPSSCQSHGMWAHTMTCQDYQDLIDRGWRRSGCYCYKPEMNTTCCPSYTIKCDAMSFRLSKSHKKIIKRINKFLKDGIKGKDDGGAEDEGGSGTHGESGGGDIEMGDIARNPRKELDLNNVRALNRKEDEREEPSHDVVDGLCLAKDRNAGSSSNLSTKSSTGGGGQPPKKAKLLRIERKREKLIQKGLNAEEIEQKMKEAKGKNVEKSLEDFLDEAPKEDDQAAHRLKVKLVPSHEGATDLVYALYCSYQMQIHKDPASKLKMDRYKRFLVKSPLKFTTGSNSPNCGFGSFHQQYWLDDRLIAVGVIDILPSCVSSVYFFYDPEFRFLSLGTYASLRELAFTRKLHQHTPSIANYYMGFYIHSCPKMRYKSNLYPSYLLCPEVYSWHLLDARVVQKLDQNKYCRLNEDPKAVDRNAVGPEDIEKVLILHGSSYRRYSLYMKMIGLKHPDENTRLYANLVGRECSARMLLYEA
ncbi:AAEL005885-PC [Aedes aegypti]|uniref:Arginyl-tRNA--protein transferase 1 n=2 Tax=Aedes aegypti TaxID=7159 RepID=A0A1S4FBT6_AEDAE|nr:arginyl-tRNA--protein transferase 1 isoform X2 [Aedes aegypti]EAT42617.1 AAEL005885-PC [Aedes aegypti]